MWTVKPAPRQIDVHISHPPPGRLNAENLPVKVACMDEARLESGPTGRLYELVGPHKAWKGRNITRFALGPKDLSVSLRHMILRTNSKDGI